MDCGNSCKLPTYKCQNILVLSYMSYICVFFANAVLSITFPWDLFLIHVALLKCFPLWWGVGGVALTLGESLKLCWWSVKNWNEVIVDGLRLKQWWWFSGRFPMCFYIYISGMCYVDMPDLFFTWMNEWALKEQFGPMSVWELSLFQTSNIVSKCLWASGSKVLWPGPLATMKAKPSSWTMITVYLSSMLLLGPLQTQSRAHLTYGHHDTN